MAAQKGQRNEDASGDCTYKPRSPQCRHDQLPAPSRFTAINAPRFSQAPGFDPRRIEFEDTTRLDPRLGPERPTGSPVSNLLDCNANPGMKASFKQVDGPLHGPGAKKTASSARKRTRKSSALIVRKQQKKGNLLDTMPVAKTTDQLSSDHGIGLSNQSPAHRDGSGKTLSDNHSSGHQGQSVAVFTPQTSMDALHNSSLQTSLQTVKSSPGQSTTVYSRLPPSSKPSAGGSSIKVQLSPFGQVSSSIDAKIDRGVVKLPEVTQYSLKSSSAFALQTRKDGTQQLKSLPNSNETLVKDNHRGKALVRNTEGLQIKPADDLDLFSDDDEVLSAVLDLVDPPEAQAKQRNQEKPPQHHYVERTEPHRLVMTPQSPDQRSESDTKKPSGLFGPDVQSLNSIDNNESHILDNAREPESAMRPRSATPSSRDRRMNLRDVDEHEDYGGALLSDADQRIFGQLKAKTVNDRRPVVRQPFPVCILDRSPIYGAANNLILRTCFRIGEALKVGAQAVRTKQDTMLEIYARVTSSHREEHCGRRQNFVLKDLYHDHGPYLEGLSELWHQSRLWERDSRTFLAAEGQGIMCRAIARLKRDFQETKWTLEILNIWEVTWEDVEYAAAIFSNSVSRPC